MIHILHIYSINIASFEISNQTIRKKYKLNYYCFQLNNQITSIASKTLNNENMLINEVCIIMIILQYKISDLLVATMTKSCDYGCLQLKGSRLLIKCNIQYNSSLLDILLNFNFTLSKSYFKIIYYNNFIEQIWLNWLSFLLK